MAVADVVRRREISETKRICISDASALEGFTLGGDGGGRGVLGKP